MSSRTEQIMAYVEKMTDKERQALLSHLKKHEKAKSEPETSELPEKGAVLVSSCMEKLLCFVWQRNRTVFAYEDAVLTYGSHKPFDPRKVAAFRRKLPAGEPWGFFVGGMDSPQAVNGENARMISDALGWSFSPSVLAQAYLIASHKDAGGGPDMMQDFCIPSTAMLEFVIEN